MYRCRGSSVDLIASGSVDAAVTAAMFDVDGRPQLVPSRE
jgi:hypothetical protein